MATEEMGAENEFGRRDIILGVGAAMLTAAVGSKPANAARAAAKSGSDAERWISTWVAATISTLETTKTFGIPAREFSNQTLRQIIFTSAGGSALRIRVSNRLGTKPLVLGRASFGVTAKPNGIDVSLVKDRIKPITFGGKPSVTVPVGEELASDPVTIDILRHQTIAIDMFFPQGTGPAENGQAGLTFVASGDRVGDPISDGFSMGDKGQAMTGGTASYYLRGVDVINPVVKDVIVCGADSLSFGTLSAFDGPVKWPQLLSRRLHAQYAEQAPSVVQSTLSGCRLLTSGPPSLSILERFEADFLSQPGVTKVILFVGFNDIALGNFPHTPEWEGRYGPLTIPTLEMMAAGYTKVVKMAHARGIKIYGCTITPGANIVFRDIHFWPEHSDTLRHSLNQWFRTEGVKIFDGVFDFASAVEHPYNKASFDPSCSSDGVHPSSGGFYVLANTVDLRRLMA